MTVYQQLFRKVRTHCGVELTDETEKREEFFMRKMGMMRNRMAFLLAAGTMTMTSAAGLAGCTSAPASVTVQSAENTGITVTSQEKIKAEPDIAEITYSAVSYTHLDVYKRQNLWKNHNPEPENALGKLQRSWKPKF